MDETKKAMIKTLQRHWDRISHTAEHIGMGEYELKRYMSESGFNMERRFVEEVLGTKIDIVDNTVRERK